MVAAIGYTTYRKNKWNIEVYIHTYINQKYYINLIRVTNQRKIGKISYQWHYELDSSERANI